jgi:hypothetical protein
MVATEPGGTLGLVHETGAAFGQVHVPPPVVTADTETKVVLAGVASVKVPLLQLLGPPLLMVCVYVILLPAVTGLGVPVFVTVRSHLSTSGVVTTMFVLFAELGSLVVDVTDEVAVIGDVVTVGATFTTTMMLAEALAAKLDAVQVTEVVVVQDQPAGAETEAKVVLAGIPSVKVRLAADAGPSLVIVCV